MLVGACESDVMPDSHGIQAWVGAYAYENYTDPPLVQRFDNASKVHAAVRSRFAVVSSLFVNGCFLPTRYSCVSLTSGAIGSFQTPLPGAHPVGRIRERTRRVQQLGSVAGGLGRLGRRRGQRHGAAAKQFVVRLHRDAISFLGAGVCHHQGVVNRLVRKWCPAGDHAHRGSSRTPQLPRL